MASNRYVMKLLNSHLSWANKRKNKNEKNIYFFFKTKKTQKRRKTVLEIACENGIVITGSWLGYRNCCPKNKLFARTKTILCYFVYFLFLQSFRILRPDDWPVPEHWEIRDNKDAHWYRELSSRTSLRLCNWIDRNVIQQGGGSTNRNDHGLGPSG